MSESTLVKMLHCWKSHALANLIAKDILNNYFCHASGVSCDVDIPDGQLTESSLKTVEDTCSVSFCNGTVKQSLLNSNLVCATTGSFVANSSTLCEG